MGRIDARVRITVASIAVILITLVLDPVAYLILTVTLVSGCVILQLPWSDYRKVIVWFLPMATITLLLHLLFNRSGQTIIATILGLPISKEALRSGLLFSWRLGLFLLAALCFTRTISADDFARGIWRMSQPIRRLGLALDGICLALWMAIRFIPTIFAQYHQIVFAQKARGATFGGGLITRTRKLVPLLAPITIAAIRRSEILADALIVRGWGVGATRTFYDQRSLSLLDIVSLLGSLVWGGMILWIGI